MTDLTKECLDGWNCQDEALDNPYLHSSPSFLAFRAGAQFYKTGASRPVKCKMGRGYSLRIYTAANEYVAKPDNRLGVFHFERK
jgi:hypothetical protein